VRPARSSVTGAASPKKPDRGRDEGKLRPSLRTGQADFLHPALQLVVTFKKIDMPPRVLVLRYTSPLW